MKWRREREHTMRLTSFLLICAAFLLIPLRVPAQELAAPQNTQVATTSAIVIASADAATKAEESTSEAEELPLNAPVVSESSACPATACSIGQLRPQDEFWVIQTGHLPWLDCQGFCSPTFGVSKYHCNGWQTTPLADFLASTEGAATVFYVPGNRVANEDAVHRGWLIYNVLSTTSDERPIRMVVWSWPSDKIRGPRRDFRVKAERTTSEAAYLGWLLTRFSPNAQLGLIGFSYGSRIVNGALHATSTGQVDGIALPDYVANEDRRTMRVVLMAAATHNYWTLPGYVHGSAFTMVDRMLLMFNPCDNALKHYHMVDRCERGCALGLTGFLGTSALGEVEQRLRQMDVSGAVGSKHAELNYLHHSGLMAEAQRYLLWGEVGE